MKNYLGCKLIQAEPMSKHSFINKIKNEDIPQNEENQPGYLVRYSDSYTSWSPKDVFEIAYREVTPQENKMVLEANYRVKDDEGEIVGRKIVDY